MNKETKQKIVKLLITIGIILLVCLAVYLPLQLTGTINKINSAEKLKEVILSGGAYSYLIYFAIQFLQVTFLPLPAFVTTVPGTWVFGPWVAFGISFFAIMAGTIFAFFLGRKIGKPIINWIVGEKDAIKWNEKLEKGKFVFFLMMLFPFFPDDILCLLVGATNMSFKFFLVTNLISRPIGTACTCFLGSGILIPFSGWGIPVWIVLIALMGVAFYISWKYQKQIENFVTSLGAKISKKQQPKLVEGENNNTETGNELSGLVNNQEEFINNVEISNEQSEQETESLEPNIKKVEQESIDDLKIETNKKTKRKSNKNKNRIC